MTATSRSAPRAPRLGLATRIFVLLVTTSLLVPVLAGAAGARPPVPTSAHASTSTRDLVRVESPAARSTVNGTAVNATLAFGDHADPTSLRAWLNGRSITARFGALQGGRRSATITLADPLKFDGNVLVVAVERDRHHGRGNGHARRSLGGRDVDVVPFSFELAQLADPDAPPTIPVNTRVGPDLEGSVAVQIGGTTHDMPDLDLPTINACPPNTTARGVWVLRLDRSTLERKGDLEFPTCTPDQIAAMRNALAALPTTDLVIVNTYIVGRDLSTFLPAPLELGDALSVVGTTNELGLSSSINDITMSAIGVPGMPPGQAFQRIAPYAADACGPKGGSDCLTGANMAGYFVLDPHDNYTFTPLVHVDYDTRSGTDATGNTIRVGPTKYVAPPLPAGAKGGFQVLVLNRTTLEPMQCGDPIRPCNATFATNASDPSTSYDEIATMANYISGWHESNGELLIVASIGAPLALSVGGRSTLVRLALAHAIESIGGTYDTIIDTTSEPYALLGSGLDRFVKGVQLQGVKPVSEIEASSFITPYAKGPSGRLAGVLERGQQWLFTPALTSLTPETGFALYQILEQPTVAWPATSGDDDLLEAYAWISAQVCACDNVFDIRLQYDDENLNWSDRRSTLNAVTWPRDKGFSSVAFTTVQHQLDAEFSDMVLVDKLFANLRSLTANSESSIHALVHTTAQEVNEVARADDAASPLKYSMVEAVAMLPEVIAMVGGEGLEPIALIGSLLEIAYEVSADEKGKSFDQIDATASELESDVVTAFDTAVHGLDTARAIIVNDWGKLSAVGHAMNGATKGSEWYWDDQRTRPRVLDALRISVRRHFYEALVPTVEGIVAVPDATSANPADFCHDPSFSPNCPFKNYPTHAYIEAPRTGDPVLELRMIAKLTPLDGSPFEFINDYRNATPPPESLMDLLTGAPTDPVTGPLGIYKPWIFRHWDFTGVACSAQDIHKACVPLVKTTP